MEHQRCVLGRTGAPQRSEVAKSTNQHESHNLGGHMEDYCCVQNELDRDETVKRELK